MYYDIGSYDMINSKLKGMCQKSWSERFNYLCIDMTRNKYEGNYRIFKESQTTYIECIPKSEPF